MLKLIKIKDPSLRWELLSELNPEKDCYLVSDIKTKLSMERGLLDKRGFLPGFCLARAKEFYTELFFSLDTDWNLRPDLFVKGLLAEFCENSPEAWIQNLKNSQSFFEFFNSFLPVLSHQEHFRLFEEWLADRQKPVAWRAWFKLSQKLFSFLQSKKILHESGLKSILPGLLAGRESLSFPKERIFADLAFSFDLSEKEIFKELSRHREVYALSPELEKRDGFKFDGGAYQQLEEELSAGPAVFFEDWFNQPKSRAPAQKPSPPASFAMVQSETQIEELRRAAAQVCQWLKRGIPPKEIALFAPDMEEYWPALRSYFRREKILAQKSVFASLADFPDIARFLSAVRAHLGRFNFSDLERFLFYRESPRDFAAFKAALFNVPDRQFARGFLLKGKSLSPDKKITGRKFVEWALAFWPKEGGAVLLDRLSKIMQNFCVEEPLKASAWLSCLESAVLSEEIEIEKEDSRGVSCLSFNALFSSQSSFVFIMGLSEEALRGQPLSIFNEADRKDILDDLGFVVPAGQFREKELGLLWLLRCSRHKEVFLSFAKYNFIGDIQTPSMAYLMSELWFNARPAEKTEALSWDRAKEAKGIHQILSQSAIEKPAAKALISAFRGPPRPFYQKEEIKLSSNRLKLYTDCPFKYAAEKLFFAQAPAPADREASPLDKGLMAHKLFEEALDRFPDLKPEPERMEELIEEMRPPSQKLVYERQWLIIKQYLESLLESFLRKEREDRIAFPSLKPIALEKPFELYWNQEKRRIDSSGKYVFAGKADRIDYDERERAYALRDYKASGSNLVHANNWIKEGKEELQLTFYTQALEKGLAKDLPPGKAQALFYSVYNDDFSAKGFVEKDSSLEGLMGARSRRGSDREILDQAIANSNQLAGDALQKIEEGRFLPHPRDTKLCAYCSYRTWCRVEALKESRGDG